MSDTYYRNGRGNRIVSYTVPSTPRERVEPPPVQTTCVPAAALEAALKLADGDHSRLRFEADGTVGVYNHPRA